MTKSLYDINQEILNFMDREEFTEEEYSDFKNLQADKETKLENIHKYILNLESDNVWPESEIERLQKIIKSNNSKVESLKRLVNDTLDGEAWSYDLWWFSYRKSESLDVLNQDSVPEEFKTIETIIKVDKMAIKKAMKEWQEIPGVEIIYKKSLQIK